MKKLLLLCIIYSSTNYSEKNLSIHTAEVSDNSQFDRKPITKIQDEKSKHFHEQSLHLAQTDTSHAKNIITSQNNQFLSNIESTNKNFHNTEGILMLPELHPELQALNEKINLSKQSELTDRDKIVKKALTDLPMHNRPENIDNALNLIKKGDKAWSLMNQNKFYDAISQNISENLNTSKDILFLKQGFNTTNEEFWSIIQDNNDFQEILKSKGIPFNYNDFKSATYNMLYRTMYIHEYVKNSIFIQEFQQAYLKTLVQIQWKLFADTIIQDGKAFTSGMITLDNPLLFKLLDGYSNLVFPNYKSYNGIHPKSMWADQAYARKSSHWDGQKAFNGSNFGIDIKDPEGKILSILPGNKSHLLFGLRTNGMTFVKWEEYGTTFNIASGDYSAIKHTLRYFEKKNSTDGNQQRREKISNEIWTLFTKLHPTELSDHEKKYIESHGISAMLDILKKDNGGTAKDKQMKQFLINTMKYSPDTLHVRKGNEVILNNSLLNL